MGEDLEGRRVGPGDHVGLLDAREALDGGPVEAHPVLEGLLELGRSDRERLEETLDVGEQEPDELELPLVDGAQHKLVVYRQSHVTSLGWLLHCAPPGGYRTAKR